MQRYFGTMAAIMALLPAVQSAQAAAPSETTLGQSTTGLACDEGITSAFKPDSQTSVLLVKAYRKGEPLILSGSPTPDTPVAGNDLCLVKINIGPGNPGPADAPSTSPGIGIEIWLPSKALWNGRIHNLGGGGWAGDPQGSTTDLALDTAGSAGSPAIVAGVEGAVSATTDTGHSFSVPGSKNAAGGNGSFGLNPDGSLNKVLWKDFSERSLHEMALKTKALTRAFYGRAASFAYFDGFSTGGRQALKQVQTFADDYDGILAGAPAINWTRFITAELNPQVVMQRDLAGSRLSRAQLSAVSLAAIHACDVVGGVHLGYVPDPQQCRYDPTKDRKILCKAEGGSAEAGICLTRTQALAVNKIWYGQTLDGNTPDPARDNGFSPRLGQGQQWYGLSRGTELGALAGASPFAVASDLVAMELGDPSLATPAFINARSNGRDGWKQLSYADLLTAAQRGLELQDSGFSRINTDNPDLSAFKARGGKLIQYHGLADVLIPSQGSIHYYERVLAAMGGAQAVSPFYRLYLVPGMSHAFRNGSANPDATPPLPQHDQLYRLLTDWVEKSKAPENPVAHVEKDGESRSWPLCPYPQKAVYRQGNPLVAESYSCASIK